MFQFGFVMEKNDRYCTTCKRSTICDITCNCGLTHYCTVDCQNRNVHHRTHCFKIKQLMHDCETKYEAIPKSTEINLQAEYIVENRKKWEELVVMLIKDSKCNTTSLRLAFHLLRMLLTRHENVYQELVLLLPEVALLLNELEFCHTLIAHSGFEKRFLGANLPEISSLDVEVHQPLYAIIDNDNDAFQRDKILILNFLMVKLTFAHRIKSMQIFTKTRKRLPGSVSELIGSFVGVPNEWKKMKCPILKRQCMDMVKLLTLMDPDFVTLVVRCCQSTRTHTMLRSWPSSMSSEALRQWRDRKSVV